MDFVPANKDEVSKLLEKDENELSVEEREKIKATYLSTIKATKEGKV